MASTKSGRSMLTTIQFNDNLNKKLHRMINSIPPQALKMPSIRGNYVYDGWWTVITFIEPFSYRRPYQTCVSHILFFLLLLLLFTWSVASYQILIFSCICVSTASCLSPKKKKIDFEILKLNTVTVNAIESFQWRQNQSPNERAKKPYASCKKSPTKSMFEEKRTR